MIRRRSWFFAAGGNFANSFGGNNFVVGGKAVGEANVSFVGLSTMVEIVEEFG